MAKVVRGGTIVTSETSFEGDVAIEDGRIVRVSQPIGDEGDATGYDEVIDADGCYVLPGLIDNHTHLSMPFGGTMTADDFDTGTAAAAAGGTTCIVDFALQTDGSLLKGLETWHEKADGRAHIDYGFHLGVTDASDAAIDEISRAVEEGVSTFKLFMAYKGALMVDDFAMLRVFSKMADTGALPMVHAENGEAVAFLQERAAAAGDMVPAAHARTRPPKVEAEATSRAIELATWTSSPLFVVHVTCAPAIAAIAEARSEGLPVYGETCVHYLVLTVEELSRPGFEGAKYVCSPPLREAQDHDALWKALGKGILEICSTDHCPFNDDGQKSLGKDDFRLIPNGVPTIEFRLPLLYQYGVLANRITMPDLVRIAATVPAERFGLAPRKGTLAPGSDADLVVFDPEAKTTISAERQNMNVDYNPFEGYEVSGLARTVLSRGDVVVCDGEVVSSSGRGAYVKRQNTTEGQRAAAG